MKKNLMISATVSSLLVGSTVSASTSPTNYSGHELANQAKITIERARDMALSARAGRIADQELEKEEGGSGLRYSFDVVSDGKTFEVGIDAITGKVLENAVESPAKESKEQAAEVKPKR